MGTQPRYRYLFFVTLLLVGLLVVLQACGRNEAPATETPRAGGVTVEEEASTTGTDVPQAAEATPVPTPTPVVYTVGSVITAAAPITLFATAASSSTVLEVYGGGATFTVLEPNDQFTAYPVTNGGAAWVRVRAADGLAGWAKTDALPN